MKDIFLPSGKWRWSLDEPAGARAPRLELFDPAAPENRMQAPAPVGDDPIDDRCVAHLARDPEIRLWTDEHGIHWRITRVGPGTRYPYPFTDPHLVFDSQTAFAGLVAIDPHTHLGYLRDDELRRLRDRMHDFGARRRSFRVPDA